MALTPQETAYIRQLQAQISAQGQQLAELARRPRSIDEEIDAIVGRRIVYTLSGEQSFTIANLGQRGTPISMLVSQDGPFVMTHYPCISWYPNAPSNADQAGKWRPVSSYPLAAQQGGLSAANAESTYLDIIDVAYELVDGGSGRQFQNLTVGPHLISTRENMIPLPAKTLFAPNASLQVFITYLDIFFGTAATNDTTGGMLHVDIPGFRIVNLGQ
jgi:hypothetical protein